MADGNLGELWFSLDIKGKIDEKLSLYDSKIKELNNLIKKTQEDINDASNALSQMAKGSDAWTKQKNDIRDSFRLVADFVNQIKIYEEALSRVQRVQSRIEKGGLLGPSRTMTTLLDTKPIEESISKYERLESLMVKLQEVESRRPRNAMDFVFSDRAGNKDFTAYKAAMETYRNQTAELRSEINALGGEGKSLADVRSQLDSLYNSLARFDDANRRASSSTRNATSEEERRARAIKDARIAFEPLVAAQLREEAQEKANRANIEATNAARQKQVQLLREQAEAMMRNKLASLESQKRAMGQLYIQGKSLGLDPAELETILSRYRELAREVLNFQTMMQNPSSMSYNSMFSMGRFSGVGANYVREASEQVSALRTRTQEAAYAARDLAAAFDRVHSSASRSSQVLSDMKSLFLQGGIVFAAQQFANSVIQTGGDIVQQHVALRSILNDMEKADQLFQQTQQLALQSPFKFQELNRDVKQLAAFGVDTDKLYDTTKRLADVASGLGVSFERLGLAYGQVKARSWLDGKELRQFAYAGLPMLQKIADLYNQTRRNGRSDYTTSDIRNMITKRQVRFEDVDEVFKKLTDAGGQFYNMQFVLSDTLLGKWNKLQDAWSIMLGKLASGKSIVGGTFGAILQGVTTLLTNIEKIGPVFLAAFAGFGAHKLMNLVGGNLGRDILSAKGKLAGDYERRALAGQQLNAVETRILATKRQINIEDLQALRNAGTLTDVEIQRLYVAGRITTEQYKQMMGIKGSMAASMNLTRIWNSFRGHVGTAWRSVRGFFTNITAGIRQIRTNSSVFFGNFVRRVGVGIGLIGTGIKNLATGIWSALGGLPGLIITGASMLIMKLWSDSENLKQSISTMSDFARQKYDDLTEYINQNPLKLKVDEGDIAKQIEAEKDELKEKAGSLYDTILNNAKAGSGVSVNGIAPGGDLTNQLLYLRQYTTLLAEAEKRSQGLQGWFARIIDDTDSLFGKSLASNLADVEEKATDLQVVLPKLNMKGLVEDAKTIKSQGDASGWSKDFQKMAQYILDADKNGKSLSETLAGLKKDYITKDLDTSTDVKGNSVFDFASAQKNLLAEGADVDKQIGQVAQNIASEFKNVATDPMEQAMYNSLKEAWKSANNLDVVQGNYFDMKLDKAVGLSDFPSLAEDVAKDAASRMSDSTKEILATGQPLTESAKKDVKKARDEAMDNLRVMWPGTASEIQAILNSKRFAINVDMHILGDNKVTDDYLDNLYLGKGPSLSGHTKQLSANGSSHYNQWKQGASNEVEVEKNARQAVDQALERLQSDKRQGLSTAESLADYNNAKAAFREVIGYAYAGGSTGVSSKEDKKARQQANARAAAQRRAEQARERARAAAERAERAYMRARQKEKSSIQKYYEAWKSWREIVGDDEARKKVAEDKRFSESFRKAYENPEDIAGNYDKLASSIAQTTDERKQFVQELNADAADKAAAKELELTKRINDAFKEQLDNLSKKYDIYERIVKVAGREAAGSFAFGGNEHSDSYYKFLIGKLEKMFGNSEISSKSYANGEGIKTINDSGAVLSGVTALSNVKKLDLDKLRKGITLDEAISEPYEVVKEKFGMQIADMFKLAKAERDKLDASIAQTLEDGYKSMENYSAALDGINKKYDEQIERLKERNKLQDDNLDYVSDTDLALQTAVINQQRRKETGAETYKQLQKSDVWQRFFGATFLLSTRGADMFAKAIRDGLAKAFENGSITADEYAQKLQEVQEQMDKITSRRSELFTYLTGGIDAVLNQRKEDGQKEIERGSKMQADALELINRGEATPGQEGLNLKIQGESMLADGKKILEGGQSMMQGAGKAATTVAIIDKIVHGINDNVQKLKALIDDIAQSIETFAGSDHVDSFKSSKGYAFISGFSSASQGATDAWDSLKSGNVMGVLEGGYRSIIGWAEPWAKRHDAKLDKQIQAAERTNKILTNLQNSMERTLSNTLGGVYGYRSKEDDLKTIKDGLDNYSLAKTGKRYGHNTVGRSAVIGAGVGVAAGLGTGALIGSAAGPIGAAVGAVVGTIVGALFGHKKKKYRTNYSDDTYEAMEKADKTGAYYDQMYAAYKMQRDNLQAQLNAESDKKKKDKDKINDYKTQLGELDDKIKTFAKDMAKSLYDIDIKSWANELTDAVVSAWAAGEDAVEAYRDKVKSIMRNLATNIIQQKVMQIALQPVEDYVEKTMAAKSGKLDENDIETMADMLMKAGDSATENIVAFMEKLKAAGWDLSDENSASMSSSIKGITESTADLLAAYLNAIRADVSVIRQLTSKEFPELNVTATAQLQQLNMISANTLRNAEAAEKIEKSNVEILYLFRGVTTDTKRVSVAVK